MQVRVSQCKFLAQAEMFYIERQFHRPKVRKTNQDTSTPSLKTD